MSFLDYVPTKKNTAQLAKQRLQVVIAQQRTARSRHDFLPDMQRELLEVIHKYIVIDDGQIQLEKDGGYEVLELNVTLPERG